METKDLQNSDSVQNEQQGASPIMDKQSEGLNSEIENTIAETENVDEQELAISNSELEDTFLDDDSDQDTVSDFEQKEGELEIDYTKLTREELVEELTKLIEPSSINDIRKEVEAIKASFYKKQKALNEKKRKEFLAEGGDIEGFALIEDPLEIALKELFKKYRSLKAEYNRKLENVKDVNLKKKYDIIEELKELINKDESIVDTFREFKDLQRRWKEVGQVPQQKLKDLWSTYHHHVEKFYDYVNINKELRDLDLRKNAEIKAELCEKAEKLIAEQSVVSAFRNLQKLHNQWREVGPVPNDAKDEIWERFKEATRVINKQHQDYFKNLKNDQKNNLERKEELCDKVEEIISKELSSHKEWSEQTTAILNLQKVWRTIGFAPKKENNRIYARFRNACDKFYAEKRGFYAQNKELQDDNLKKKIELCERAEALKDSIDWKKASNDLIILQKEWKEVGPVSRKQSDKVWKRFRAACDHFFGRKTAFYANIEQDYESNLKLKQEIILKIKNFQFGDNANENFEALKKLQEEFSEIGFVPYKLKDKIQNEYREELNNQFDKLKVGETERSLLKFQTRLETMQHKPKSYSKIKHERDKFFNKIKKIETDIALWENNIGFFSTESAEAKEMLKDYKEKIELARKEILMLEEKVRMIDRADPE